MTKIFLFLGTRRGENVLNELIKNKRNISGVLVLQQESHEIDRADKKIINICKTNRIPFFTTKTIKPRNYENLLRKFTPEIVFVISWRNIIPASCFDIPRHGIYVLHDSLLPKYRGFAPTNWVIINGEKETGLTLQKISVNMDAGEIVDQIKLKITQSDTATSLNNKFIEIYPKIILKNIDKIISKKVVLKKQNEKNASYTTKRTPEDGRININDSTRKIVNLIKGLSFPYPGAFFYYNNKKITVWEAEKVINPPTYSGRIPGKIVGIQKRYVDILTGDGILRVRKISNEKSKRIVTPEKILKKLSVKVL